MIDALQDAQGMGGDAVSAGGAEIVSGKALQDFVGKPVGGGESKPQRVGIGNAGAVEVRRSELLFFSQGFDLGGSPVDNDLPNVQRAENGDIQEDVGKILVGDNRAIQADDEGLLAEARNVLQDSPQVSRFHVWAV